MQRIGPNDVDFAFGEIPPVEVDKFGRMPILQTAALVPKILHGLSSDALGRPMPKTVVNIQI